MFEFLHEGESIAVIPRPTDEQMNVVRHQAVGMRDKSTFLGSVAQNFEDLSGKVVVGEELLPADAASREEIPLLAAVALW